MKLTLELQLDNAAFGGDTDDYRNGNEIHHILTELARDRFEDIDVQDGDCGNLRDTNGNACGSYSISKE